MNDSHYYIAYGSNLNLGQMKQRCPTAELVGTATLNGWALRFRTVATVEPCEDESVPVLIWSIQPQDEEALDRYEGWPQLYRKETVHVELEGQDVPAMIYIMNEKYRAYTPPNIGYYGIIHEGYKCAGFPTSTLDNAIAHALAAKRNREILSGLRSGLLFKNLLAERNDDIDSAAYQLANALALKEVEGDDLEWDMAYIGEIVDAAKSILEEQNIHCCHPFYEGDEQTPCYRGKDCKLTDCPLRVAERTE